MSFDPFLDSTYAARRYRESVASFGEIAGQKTLADLQDLLTSVRYRMTQLGAALGQVNPLQVKDQSAFAALMVDIGNLKTRVSRADSDATAALTSAALNPLVVLSFTPAQSQYDGLMRAMKQGYPPDGAKVQRGDYDDVVNRIRQVTQVKVDLSQMPQPKAADPDRTILRQIPQIPDVPKPVELGWMEELYRFVKGHEKEILIGSVLVGGWLLWTMAPHIVPAAKTAAKAIVLA